MTYKIDYDLHIHSKLSLCSSDPEQTVENILNAAKANRLSTVCITDHYWDSAVAGASDWYRTQNFEHISGILPLSSKSSVRALFGCETDLDRHFTLGIPPSRFSDFDFIIVPTTHLHMNGFTISDEDQNSSERRARLWVERLDAVLNMPLPFAKVGIAHLACPLLDRRSPSDYFKTLSQIPDSEMERLFAKAASLGCGIELNQTDMSFPDAAESAVLRPFRIAKSCGCKFYLGSDAHHPKGFLRMREVFERAVRLLDLRESDKFRI